MQQDDIPTPSAYTGPGPAFEDPFLRSFYESPGAGAGAGAETAPSGQFYRPVDERAGGGVGGVGAIGDYLPPPPTPLHHHASSPPLSHPLTPLLPPSHPLTTPTPHHLAPLVSTILPSCISPHLSDGISPLLSGWIPPLTLTASPLARHCRLGKQHL